MSDKLSYLWPVLTALRYKNLTVWILFMACWRCVPLQQQVSEREDEEIDGFVCPLVIDEEKVNQIAPLNFSDKLVLKDSFEPYKDITYASTFDGKPVFIRSCRCLSDVKIIQNKLSMIHTYGGGERNKEHTKLLWNGRHYKNAKGEPVVDLILFVDTNDTRRAGFIERKILEIAPVQIKEANLVWINLLGYDQLIKYSY
jgi:hypothetical protein